MRPRNLAWCLFGVLLGCKHPGGPPGGGEPGPGTDPDAMDPDAPPTAHCAPPYSIDSIAQTLDDHLSGALPITGIVTGAAIEERPLAHQGYLTLRFDLPLEGCADPKLPILAFAAIDEPEGPAPTHTTFPGLFDDQRVGLRAELASRMRHAAPTMADAFRRYLGEIAVDASAVTGFVAPPASSCTAAFAPLGFCADDARRGEPYGLVVDVELFSLRGAKHAVPAFVASDLLVGQLPTEGGWSQQLTMPIPDDSAREYFPLTVRLAGRAHLTFHAMNDPSGASPPGEFFAAFDVWSTIGIAQIDGVSEPAQFYAEADGKVRYDDDAKLLESFHEMPSATAEGDPSLTFELAREPGWGCW